MKNVKPKQTKMKPKVKRLKSAPSFTAPSIRKELDTAIDHMIKPKHYNKIAKAYLYRLVLSIDPKDVLTILGLNPSQLKEMEAEGAKLFTTEDIDGSFKRLLTSLQGFKHREQLRAHRNHTRKVAERMTNKLIETA